MERKIKQAFAAVEAGEALREKTMARLAQRTGNFGERRKPWARRLAAAGCSLGAVCAAGLLGGWLYFTPTAAVHLDLEQPLWLSVNRFGLVVGADSPQEEEAALGEAFQHRPVAQAVEAIVAESAPLAEEGDLTIAVTGEGPGPVRGDLVPGGGLRREKPPAPWRRKRTWKPPRRRGCPTASTGFTCSWLSLTRSSPPRTWRACP